jgi:putative chitinase
VPFILQKGNNMLTHLQLKLIVPTLTVEKAAATLKGLLPAVEYAELNTPARQGGFIAQCAHESRGFSVFTENLNYSAAGLRTTFRKYFTEEQAHAFERHPERIGNKVYANRLGNGNEASGDGYRFRGRGAIQCTGKDKYLILSKLFGVDFIANPELLATPEYACLSAAWYWKDRKINVFADAKDIRNMTLAVNGGLNGFDERKEYYARAKTVLAF